MTPSPAFAVIFDMDGVIVDSEPLHLRAYVQAWSEFGLDLDPAECIHRCMIEGMLIRTLFELKGGDPDDWDDLFRRKTEIYSVLVKSDLKLMPGALDLLRDLRANDIPCALATSAARASMDLVFEAHGLAPHFDATVTLDDVANHKPDPEAFLKAAALLGVPPSQCIVVEDAPKGIAAAKAAGMKCVAVPTALSKSEDFSGADLAVESLDELTPQRLRALVSGDGQVLGCERHLVTLLPYQPAWAGLFEQEAQRLRAALGDHIVGIGHVGSTSVPGLDAKPILDVVVAVRDMTDALPFEEALAPLGYVHQQANDMPGRLYFVKRTPDDRSTHHLNITEFGTECWFEHVAFRDYLLTHPEAKAEYLELKRQLAREHPADRRAYGEGKEPFIRRILALARKRERGAL